MSPLADRRTRAEYYGEYWRAPEFVESEHLRWKADLTRRNPRVLAARSILDIGCGSGQILSAVHRPGVRVCGVEMSSEAQKSLAGRGIEAHAVDLETESLPFPDGSFDVVLCYDVLEHVFSPGRLLGEMSRVVHPGGTLLLCVPNTLNLFNRLLFLSGEFGDVMDTSHRSDDLFSNHVRLFSKNLFERFLERHRLHILERHYYFPARFSDARFKMPPWLARAVTGPRLHERLPGVFALGFLYVSELA